MNLSELRKKSETEIKAELAELHREQFNLQMQKATNQLNKSHLLRAVRRNIARVKTVLHEQKGKS
jgi:large subunit ribosomal protein L29